MTVEGEDEVSVCGEVVEKVVGVDFEVGHRGDMELV